MGENSLCQKISRLVEPILQIEKVELVDIEFKKEGRNWFLRIFIDKPSGITLNDCQTVSHGIEDLIEIEGLIHEKYTLEVSSPGLERPLKKERDFLRNKDREVRLTTISSIQDRKRFLGIIKDVRDESLLLESKGNIVLIPLKKIAKAKLEIQFT